MDQESSRNAADAEGSELVACRRCRAIDVDTAASILEDDGFEAFAPRVFSRITDAEIKSEASQKNPGKAALAQISGQSRGGFMIIFIKRRIGIDLSMITFAQN